MNKAGTGCMYFKLLFLNGKRVRNMEKEAGYTVADY
jgi:hypothetical protein